MRFGGPNMAITANDFGLVELRDEIKIRGKDGTKFSSEDGHSLHTTVGRILFNSVLPDDYPFVNEEINKAKMSEIVGDLLKIYGIQELPRILDQIKEFGFEYATKSGITWGMDDITIPEQKPEIVNEATEKVKNVVKQHGEGLLSDVEKRRKITAIWHEAKSKLEELIPETLDPKGSVYDMWKSGARGSLGQLTNMAGMKGLIINSKGEEIEFPVLSCSKEGFSPIEYFISTHGSRKGLTDTALNTAKAGYLTRRLFVAAQDVIVSEEDCGTKKHIVISSNSDSGIEVSMAKKIRGRVLAAEIKNPEGKVLFKKNHLVSKLDADAIELAGVIDVPVYSPLTCECNRGVCVKCYGVDLGNDHMVDVGEAVGTVAAQAIGEPGTQLTMRTFHAGGTAVVGGDITQGLPRVEEIFERRKPKAPAIIAKIKGTVLEIRDEGKDKIITLMAEDGVKTKAKEIEYIVPPIRSILISKGDAVEKGQLMTDGSADLSDLYKYAGLEKTQEYIISQINKIYELQGESVSRKHIEIIVRQMFSKARIVIGGDTKFTTGEVISRIDLNEENEKIASAGGDVAQADIIILGITETSLTRKSFLSAASFQHTTKVLINSSVKGIEDELHGLMENVILGRLIPAGTGFKGSTKYAGVQEIEENAKKELEGMQSREYNK